MIQWLAVELAAILSFCSFHLPLEHVVIFGIVQENLSHEGEACPSPWVLLPAGLDI